MIVLKRSQIDKDKYPMRALKCRIEKMIQTNLFTKQKQTYRCREETYGYQRGKVGGRDKLGVWD